MIAILLFAAMAAVVSSAPSSAGATKSPHRAARPLAIKGKPSPLKLTRKVFAGKLPKPKPGPPKSTEPNETKPISHGIRRTGVVALIRTKGARTPVATGPDFTLGISVPGVSIDGKTPPDTQIAASPKYVMEAVNDAGLVLNTAGAVLGSFDLGSLFTGVAGQGTDPKVVYDASSGHFFATYLVGNDTKSTVYLGVASNPLGSWGIYTVSTENLLQDQPKLGVSSNKITMSWNNNGNSGPEQYKVAQKAGVVALLSSVPGVIWGPDSTRLNVIPAVQLTPSATAYAVFHNYNSASVGLMSFTGVPGISPVSFTQKILGVAHTTSPPGAAQPGAGSPLLDTGDDRLESAVWRNGTLWAGGNDRCEYRTDTAPRSCLRVIHISTTGMSVVQDVDITMVGGSVMYPAVMTDSRGNFWVAFSSSAASQFASSEVAEAPGGKIGGTIGGIIYRTGSGTLNTLGCTTDKRDRFGDYSGATVDPTAGVVRIWAATEFGALSAKVPCSWGTQIARFTP